jgi:hypothetical protein
MTGVMALRAAEGPTVTAFVGAGVELRRSVDENVAMVAEASSMLMATIMLLHCAQL